MRVKHMSVLLAFLIALMAFAPLAAAAINIDSGLVDLAFQKLSSLDDATKSDAMSLLQDYFRTEQGLDTLKQDLPGILKLVIGDDYEQKLQEEGISLSRIKSDIDELKNWSRDDRMALLDMMEKGDKDGVKDLLEQYASSGTGGASGAAGGGASTAVSGMGSAAFPEVEVKFSDIQKHWAKPYIEAMAKKGILTGRAEGVFAPDEKVTRAEFVAMLVRLLQLQAPSEGTFAVFPDVTEKDWFYAPVRAAYAAGLAKGKQSGFDPKGLITREEMVSFVVRAASMKNKSAFVDSAEIEYLLLRFKDKEAISAWARTDVAVALKLSLVSGMKADEFSPRGTATRAQAACIIYNLYNLIYE
ncbi:MAG: S-layer homology domain-containing protein [Tepidanaerobacteraceae bacterium]|jgi:hypothetical protein|nr:S-layer homology domain-containing protein [Tepidanaerobacteraceae bacterium]